MKNSSLFLAVFLFAVCGRLASLSAQSEQASEFFACPPDPAPPTVTHDTVCIGQSATLTASAPSGSVINWYTDPVGGSPIYTGSVFITPPLNVSQTWYVEVEKCHSFALRFPMGNDKVDCGNPPGNLFDMLDDGTVEAWVIGAPGEVIGKDEGPGNNVPKWFFGVGGGGMEFHINGPGYGNGYWVYSSGWTPPSGWHHVAVVKSGNNISFYANGSPVGGGTLPQPAVPSGAPLTIGWGESCCQAAGTIDEVRIYSTARSQGDIAASMNQCADPNGLIAYYPMNDMPGQNTVEDFSGGGNNGTLVNMNPATAWVEGYPLCCFPSCIGSSTRVPVIATVLSDPIPDIIPSAQSLCNGQSVTLNAGVFSSYQWSTGGTAQSIIVTSPGTYSVTVANAAGCTGTDSETITAAAGPTPTITSPGLSICSGGSTLLDAGAGYANYLWSNNAATQTITVNMPGTYSVTVTDTDGCTGSASATVVADQPPVLSSTVTAATCGLSNGAVNLTVTGGVPPYDFLWSNGATTEDLIDVAGGSYTVTVTGGNGCTSTAVATVPNNNIPLSVSGAAAPVTSCNTDNGSVNINVAPAGSYTYSWSNGATTQDISNIPAGTYTVTVGSLPATTALL